MTYYYYYNPKQFIDPGWGSGPTGEELKKKRHHLYEAKESLKVIENTKEFTPELKKKASELDKITEKIETIEEQAERLRFEMIRFIISEQILFMREEEEALLLLLLLLD